MLKQFIVERLEYGCKKILNLRSPSWFSAD